MIAQTKRRIVIQTSQKGAKNNPLAEARKQLESAEMLRQQYKLDEAQKICEHLLEKFPDYSGAFHTLGLIHADKQEYEPALTNLVRASMLNPRNWPTLIALSGVYLRLGSPTMATRTLEDARKYQPKNASILATLGEIHRSEREYELGAQAFREALELDPSLNEVKRGLCDCCMHLGELSEAAKAIEDCIRAKPGSVGDVYTLSQLPPGLVGFDLTKLMENIPTKIGIDAQKDASRRAFASARICDNAGEYEKAWEFVSKANDLEQSNHVEGHENDRRYHQVFLEGVRKTSVPIKQYEPNLSGQAISLFILGPSRSGKTTAERLAGSIDGVKRGYESPIIKNTTRETFRTAALPTRNNIYEVPPGLDNLFREIYSEELEQRASGYEVFTNTHPGQITSALRAAVTIPNMRYVFMKRDFDDICFRIFNKTYAEGNHYSYRLDWVREFVTWYYEMIDLLVERLPDTSIVIQYEEMIQDPKLVRQKIAKLCGLPKPIGRLPALGDDRACAKAYADFMNGSASQN